MEMPTEEFLILQQAHFAAERKYAIDPKDADNLTTWGIVLLELSQILAGDGDEANRMILASISKFEEAVSVDPFKHDAIWGLGSAYMTRGLLTADYNVARDYFDTAEEFYLQAVDQNPNNQKYIQSLGSIAKAAQYHAQFHKKGITKEAAGASSTSYAKGTKKERNYDLLFDIGGWAVLAVGIATWLVIARNQAPPAPEY